MLLHLYVHFLIAERYSLLGARKDYWNFIIESIPKDDGVKFVQALPQVNKDPLNFCLQLNKFRLLGRWKNAWC